LDALCIQFVVRLTFHSKKKIVCFFGSAFKFLIDFSSFFLKFCFPFSLSLKYMNFKITQNPPKLEKGRKKTITKKHKRDFFDVSFWLYFFFIFRLSYFSFIFKLFLGFQKQIWKRSQFVLPFLQRNRKHDLFLIEHNTTYRWKYYCMIL